MSINKLVLPDSVKSIGNYSFKDPSNLAKVNIGGGSLTSLDSIITALRDKGLTIQSTIFGGISKIHPSHGFTYTVTKDATCTESGSKTGTCDCGNTDIQTISATGHSYGDWVLSSDESTKTRTCSKCGNKETATVTKVELRYASAATKEKYGFAVSGFMIPSFSMKYNTQKGIDAGSVSARVLSKTSEYIMSADHNGNITASSGTINENDILYNSITYKDKIVYVKGIVYQNYVNYDTTDPNQPEGHGAGYYRMIGMGRPHVVTNNTTNVGMISVIGTKYLGDSYKVPQV